MIKRLITAIVITFLLAALCISGNLIVTSKMKNIEKSLEIIEKTAISNIKESYILAKECEESFHNNETILCFFSNHGKLDELKISLSLIRTYTKNEEISYLLSKCSETKMLLEDIVEEQRVSVHSIF